MSKLKNIIYKEGTISPELDLDVALKTIDMEGSCMKDEDLRQFKNKLLRKQVEQYNVTYISDKGHPHPDTPILLFDNGIIFLGMDGIIFKTPAWKFIFFCDVVNFLILDEQLQITSMNKGKEKLYRFRIDSKDSANIASVVRKYNFNPESILEINKKVLAKIPNMPQVVNVYANTSERHLPPAISAGGRRKTKRAKKSKRRTRRS